MRPEKEERGNRAEAGAGAEALAGLRPSGRAAPAAPTCTEINITKESPSERHVPRGAKERRRAQTTPSRG